MAKQPLLIIQITDEESIGWLGWIQIIQSNWPLHSRFVCVKYLLPQTVIWQPPSLPIYKMQLCCKVHTTVTRSIDTVNSKGCLTAVMSKNPKGRKYTMQGGKKKKKPVQWRKQFFGKSNSQVKFRNIMFSLKRKRHRKLHSRKYLRTI